MPRLRPAHEELVALRFEHDGTATGRFLNLLIISRWRREGRLWADCASSAGTKGKGRPGGRPFGVAQAKSSGVALSACGQTGTEQPKR